MERRLTWPKLFLHFLYTSSKSVTVWKEIKVQLGLFLFVCLKLHQPQKVKVGADSPINVSRKIEVFRAHDFASQQPNPTGCWSPRKPRLHFIKTEELHTDRRAARDIVISGWKPMVTRPIEDGENCFSYDGHNSISAKRKARMNVCSEQKSYCTCAGKNVFMLSCLRTGVPLLLHR